MQLVTLTSDIGIQDFLVGAVKGQLLSTNPNTNIVDISHYLPQTNFHHAAYICNNAFKYFPKKSIHVVLLDVFDNKNGHFILAELNNQYIICPDNGILFLIAGHTKPSNIVTIPIINANTFLDITAILCKAINLLQTGVALTQIGTNALSLIEKSALQPMIGNDWIEGQILFVDNFENVIINITKEEFEKERKGRNYKIVFKRNEVITTLSNNYTSVTEGEYLAWFNSAGYLELSINKGNVASLFGLERFNEQMHKQNALLQNKWFYQTIRIFFE